jgi:hypothetical protein
MSVEGFFASDCPRRKGRGEKGSAMNIRKVALAFFIILGVLDIVYGLLMDDRISLLMGPVLIIIGLYLIMRERKQAPGRQ